MGIMVKISPLTDSDRTDREVLSRRHDKVTSFNGHIVYSYQRDST
jgi:hypothetical protein